MSRFGWCGAVIASLVLLPVVAVPVSPLRAGVPSPSATPTLPPVFADPTGSPSPSPTPSDAEDEGEGDTRPSGGRGSEGAPTDHGDVDDDARGPSDRVRGRKRTIKRKVPAWVQNYRTVGNYSTAVIDAAVMELAAIGWSVAETRALYVGLPIAGASSWTDSWGAPRHEFGRHYRRHEGQDLFCEYDAPVLAVSDGEVEFDTVRLGGKVARLYLADGTYWYYAHLSRWNRRFKSGDEVDKGDVIGFCGATGNAVGTPPHVHFGWYSAGDALDPIMPLIRSLQHAEAHASAILRRVESDMVTNADEHAVRRRFGDDLVPVVGRAVHLPDSVGVYSLLNLLLQQRVYAI